MKSSFLKSSSCFLISLTFFQCESDLKPQSLDQELTVRFDESFSQEEREDFLLLLDVHQSSLELWTYVEQVVQENNPEGRLLGVPQGARWKIVAADFVGGIRGGILGGGALGPLAGLVASSLVATISLWENRIPACSSADTRCRLSAGSVPRIRPIRPRGSSTYTGSINWNQLQFL